MIRLANQLYTNYQKFVLDRMCHDSVSGDDWISNGMTEICTCFLKFLGTWEPSGKVNPDVLEAAATAHILANAYFHIHVMNRRNKKSAGFGYITEFKELYQLIKDDIEIQDPAKRTLNQISISQHLADLTRKVDELSHAEDAPPVNIDMF